MVTHPSEGGEQSLLEFVVLGECRRQAGEHRIEPHNSSRRDDERKELNPNLFSPAIPYHNDKIQPTSNKTLRVIMRRYGRLRAGSPSSFVRISAPKI